MKYSAARNDKCFAYAKHEVLLRKMKYAARVRQAAEMLRVLIKNVLRKLRRSLNVQTFVYDNQYKKQARSASDTCAVGANFMCRETAHFISRLSG